MASSVSRREFLQAAVAAGTAVASTSVLGRPLHAQEPRSANEKLNFAVVGVAARGGANLNGVAGENIAVLCDIDRQHLAKASAEFPNAKTCEDYREALEHPDLDGFVVSTPDHMHAIIVAAALRKGLPVYCEKPLTHSVYEARVLRQLTAEAGVPTQMGNQIHSSPNYRRVVELVRSGIIGPVTSVHVWLGSGVRTGQRVESGEPPEHVNYDLWLGPAPYRPFHASHFHFNWRYWWDFGGGQLGDFGCHYMDLPFWALELKAPTTVAATGEKGHDGDNECPNFMKVVYEFPARGGFPPVELTWYHGGWMPEGAEAYEKNSAVLFEGEKGRILADYGTHKVFMQDGSEPKPVEPWIADSVGHHQEWIDAIRNGTQTGSHFEYGGTLTEAVLLGNVSYRAGQKKLEWDAETLQARNVPEAAQYIRREYREGWTL